jgi:hypothetical protein
MVEQKRQRQRRRRISGLLKKGGALIVSHTPQVGNIRLNPGRRRAVHVSGGHFALLS